MVRESLRSFFNEKADKWDELQSVPHEKLKRLLSHLPIKKRGVILDVGSGTGVLIPFLKEMFTPSLIVEIDISERMLAIAKRKFGSDGILYIWGDAQSYVFDVTFDGIVCYSSFPHFEDKEEGIKHLSKFLNKGGVFAIIHTLGREEIHRIHSLNEVTKGDLLPPAKDLSIIFEKNGLKVFESIDDEEKYLLAGIKT